MHINDATSEQLKQDTVSMVCQAWEIEQSQPYVINLIKYISNQSTLSEETITDYSIGFE